MNDLTKLPSLNWNPAKPPPQIGIPFYVLLHKDHTHFFSLPDGSLDWSYDQREMELREKILQTDYKNYDYNCILFAVAMPLFCNRQAELMTLWAPVIQEMQKAKTVKGRFRLYKNFRARHKCAHPIEADELLKHLLELD